MANSIRTMKQKPVIILITGFCVIYYLFMDSIGLSNLNAGIDMLSLILLLFLANQLLSTIQRFFHANSPISIANISSVVLFSAVVIIINHTSSSFLFTGEVDQIHILRFAFIPKAIFILFLLLILLIFYWAQKQRMEIEEANERQLEKERESIKIQLNSLQQQFQPHFLFNSLNSINALTISNPEEAQKMIHLLSEFMRGSIQENKSEFVTLEEEINHLKLYTDIEKVRFGERLIVNYQIPTELLSYKLPHLILQPLIENSVKYGLYGNIDAVQIDIQVKLENNQLIISMTNPFDSSTSASAKGTGYGLPSIEKKMQILYHQYNLLTIKKTDNLFTIQLIVPQI
jgi:sensor histidine kinase YesM